MKRQKVAVENSISSLFVPLQVQPLLSSFGSSEAMKAHVEYIEQLLLRMIPEEVLLRDREGFSEWVRDCLPLVTWTETQRVPDLLSIFLLCAPSRAVRTDRFFYDSIKRWLVPGQELSILSFQNMSFLLPGLHAESFFLAEVKVCIDDGRTLGTILRNLPLLAKEIAFGVSSSNYAKHALETKALSYDQKIALTHQDFIKLLQKRSHLFDGEIFTEMSRFLALSQEEFRSQRPYRHLTRLVTSLYLVRKNLRRAIVSFPEKRHLVMRFIHTTLEFPFGRKPVLGLLIGVSLLDKHEFFEEKHIVLAAQKFVPDVREVKGSFYTYQNPQDTIKTLYLELEKADGSNFSLREMHQLKDNLSDELKGRIERLIPPLFMIRNEEEVMKNILILSQELRRVSDIPQLMISFDQQSKMELIFTVLLVRVLKEDVASIQERLQTLHPEIEFSSERQQIVGHVRKKYPKEANVFRLKLPKTSTLLRTDSSVNFYLARQKVVSVLTEALGEIRDYNGGMILKQGELFAQFTHFFTAQPHVSQDLLEDFFYSLTPIEMQATLSLDCLKTFFSLFLEGMRENLVRRENHCLKTALDGTRLFIVVRAGDPSLKEDITRCLSSMTVPHSSIISASLDFQGTSCLGYIYDAPSEEAHREFIDVIKKGVLDWQDRVVGAQVLRLAFYDLPLSLDPRLGGDNCSEVILKMLYEGLMRLREDGKPACAIAQSYAISSDSRTYTFELRDCFWSNGAKIVAQDFEYAWKKILSPDFNTFFAYLFYPIKNAKLAKQGKISLEEVGILAKDEKTLVVELEYPAPYFLELTTQPLYSPVNHLIDISHPNWSTQEGGSYVCNGPWQLKKRSFYGYELIKNPFYWDSKEVHLDRILIEKASAQAAFEMFQNDDIDWLGGPLNSWESRFSKLKESAESASSLDSLPTIYWSVCNVTRFPFNHPKIRQAFAYAINREEIIRSLSFDGVPALTPLPLSHTLHEHALFQDGDVEKARQVFEEGLQELGLTRANFPVVSFILVAGEERRKRAFLMKEQWEKVLGIQCCIEQYDWSEFFMKLVQGDYQMGLMSWTSCINDPIYVLNNFRDREDKINFSNWEHPQFQKLLDEANQEVEEEKRLHYLAEAESILVREMPVIPLFHMGDRFVKKKHLQKVCSFVTGAVDFKWAFLKKESPNSF